MVWICVETAQELGRRIHRIVSGMKLSRTVDFRLDKRRHWRSRNRPLRLIVQGEILSVRLRHHPLMIMLIVGGGRLHRASRRLRTSRPLMLGRMKCRRVCGRFSRHRLVFRQSERLRVVRRVRGVVKRLRQLIRLDVLRRLRFVLQLALQRRLLMHHVVAVR